MATLPRRLLVCMLVAWTAAGICRTSAESVGVTTSEQHHSPWLLIERGDSPWAEYTGSAAEEHAGFSVAAEKLTGKLDGPASLATYSHDGKPLLVIDKARRKVVVNSAVFSNLERPDMTRIASGERLVIGTIHQIGVFADPVDLTIFLLKSQIIRTYMHLESKLRIVSKKREGNIFRVSYAGTHSYCTNRCHEAPLAFAVKIDLASGLMTTEGE